VVRLETSACPNSIQHDVTAKFQESILIDQAELWNELPYWRTELFKINLRWIHIL